MTSKEKWDLVNYRIFNAKRTLHEIDILVQNKMYNVAINRIYYACFYAVTGVLLLHDVSTKTHAGAIKMFGLHLIESGIIPAESGRFYTKLFGMRLKGDYEDYIEFNEEDALAVLPNAKILIDQIEAILKQRAHTS